MEFLRDLIDFVRSRKKYWMIPLIAILLLFGILIVYVSGSAAGALIYPLF